jgi:hypothetical protein
MIGDQEDGHELTNSLQSIGFAPLGEILFTKDFIDLQNCQVSQQRISREISSSHGGEYDVQNYLLGCTAV